MKWIRAFDCSKSHQVYEGYYGPLLVIIAAAFGHFRAHGPIKNGIGFA